MKPVKLLLMIAFICTAATHLWAENLATWTFSNGTGDWGPSPADPVSHNSNISVVGLTRGSGVGASGSAAGTAWGGNSFNDGLSVQNESTAIAQGNYVTFSFTANTGYSLSMTEIAPYNIRRSSTGPNFMIWQYSLDGVNFTDIESTITIGSTSNSSGNNKPAIQLSGIAALQNVPSGTTITFRVVIWGANGDSGTWYFNSSSSSQNTSPSLILNGLIGPVSDPLPLKLLSFRGNAGTDANQLDWTTANEVNVNRFELQRSNDGSHFEKIAVVDAKGNDKSESNAYSYEDKNAGATAYYRLLMIDENVSSVYSKVVLIRREAAIADVRIYPNPVSGTLFMEGIDQLSSYTITDALGRNIISAGKMNNESNTASLDVSGLERGIYFLQLVNSNGKQTVRFIKK